MKSEQYIQEVARTASNQFHTDVISGKQAVLELVDFEVLAQNLDNTKKALYYGKPPKPIRPMLLPEKTELNVDELHFTLGAITELAEVSEVLRAKWNGEDVGTKPADEIGDVLWYLWNLMRVLGLDPDKVMEANIAKLRARFPEKFSDSAAINRNESAEKEALNTHL